MHIKGPLQPDDCAFYRPEQRQRQDDRERRPDRQVLPSRERAGCLHRHEGANDDMADNHNDKIGGQIVGAMVVYLLTTMVATVYRLQKGLKQPALAAARTTAEKAAF